MLSLQHFLHWHTVIGARVRRLCDGREMLIKEAEWIRDALVQMDSRAIYPMLNVGSSTEYFRKQVQPWIDVLIFKPLRESGKPVIHLDVKSGTGVDIVESIADDLAVSRLKEINCRSVLCANVLEHVEGESRRKICKSIESILAPGGIIIVTCPYKYPYHPDPIDTMYRPTPDEISDLFRNCDIISKAIVGCGTHLDRLVSTRAGVFKAVLRLLTPFYKPRSWWRHVAVQSWMFRKFKVSCVVLVRN